MIGILFNHNVQAVVMPPGASAEVAQRAGNSCRYIDRLGTEEEVDDLEPGEYGPEACRLIAKVRPELDAYLITDRSAEEIAGLDLGRAGASSTIRKTFWNCT
ncbi:MAG: hypothetical protein R3D84_08005 [Paracoccaceae bacterium]